MPVTRQKRHAYRHESGAVLPVALILLILLTLAGLSSAKRAITHDVVAQNLRVNEVAQQSAESALRHCEAVVMDLVDNKGAKFPADAARVGRVVIADAEAPAALWAQPANWAAGSASRIVAPMAFTANVRAGAQGIPAPMCIAEAMAPDRYLITARGHSADSTFNANGHLITGAEVWMQSILSPQIPL